MQKLKALKNKVGKYEGLVTTYEDILTLIEMGIEEQDDSVYEEVKEMNDSFLAEYEALRIATMLDGEYDRNNAIVTLHAGTGGTEACDWTNMLFRMYSRWAQKEGFEVEVLDMLDGDEAGLKSVTIQVNGENAFFASRKGVDRDPVVAGGLPAAGGVDRHRLRAGNGLDGSRGAVHVEAVGGRRIVVLATARQTCA